MQFSPCASPVLMADNEILYVVSNATGIIQKEGPNL